MEPELVAAVDRRGAMIQGVQSRLTSEISGVEPRLTPEIHRVETEIRSLIESDVISKIEQVADGVSGAREQAERALSEELGAFGPRTLAGDAVVADIRRRLRRVEERT